jgi:hypothetical protein
VIAVQFYFKRPAVTLRPHCNQSENAAQSLCDSFQNSLLIHHSPLTTHHSPLTTHHSPLTTHHSPLTTHHSPLTTHHSPLTTHHSPLTTHHSPLTTHHSFQMPSNHSPRGKVRKTTPPPRSGSPYLCTLFSASNYGDGDNEGAYVQLCAHPFHVRVEEDSVSIVVVIVSICYGGVLCGTFLKWYYRSQCLNSFVFFSVSYIFTWTCVLLGRL